MLRNSVCVIEQVTFLDPAARLLLCKKYLKVDLFISTKANGEISKGDFNAKLKIHREKRILRHVTAIKYHVKNCAAHHVPCLA